MLKKNVFSDCWALVVREENQMFQLKSWHEISPLLADINPRLFSIINGLQADNLQFIEGRLPYGEALVECGQLNISEEESWVFEHLTHDWDTMPLGIVSEGCFEFQLANQNQAIPFASKQSGDLIGSRFAFDSHIINGLCQVYAGAKSMLLLSKVTNKTLLKRLKFIHHTDFPAPEKFQDHGPMFKALVKSPKTCSSWRAKVIFLTDRAYQLLAQNIEFHHMLLEDYLNNMPQTVRSRANRIIWAEAISKMREENILTNSALQDPQIIDTIWQIVEVATGYSPGYVPATSSQCGPVQDILHIFSHDYKIRNKIPTLLHLAYHRLNSQRPIYYSLAKPNFTLEAPKLGYRRKTVVDLLSIERGLKWFQRYICQTFADDKLNTSLLYQAMAHSEFEFFHPSGEGPIRKDIETLIQDDSRFAYWPLSSKPKGARDRASQFFHGCIRITPRVIHSKEKESKILSMTGVNG